MFVALTRETAIFVDKSANNQMMDVSLIADFGRCVFESMADRISASTISLCGAWIRESPESPKIDVTDQFARILASDGGNIMLDAAAITPDMLLGDKTDPGAPAAHRRWWNFWSKRPECGGAGRSAVGSSIPCWLMIKFGIRGGAKYIVCYNIPEEPVTFPPKLPSTTEMTPLSQQILSCSLVLTKDEQHLSQPDPEKEQEQQQQQQPKAPAATAEQEEQQDAVSEEEEEEEEEEQTVADMSDALAMYAGPDCLFFGRRIFDVRLAMADYFDTMPRADMRDALWKMISATPGCHSHVSICKGDGSQTCLDSSWQILTSPTRPSQI